MSADLNSDGQVDAFDLSILLSEWGPVVSEPVVAWSGDYQTGDFSQWTEIHSARAEQTAIVASPARANYTHTARFIVAEGDHTFSDTSTNRAEVMSTEGQSGNPAEGVEQWYAWSTYFPSGLIVPLGQWFIYTQWHHTEPTGNPNVTFAVTDAVEPGLRLRIRGENTDPSIRWEQAWELGVMPTDQWVDHKIYIKWSSDSTIGRVGVWIDGVEKVAPSTPAATLYSGQSAYLKQGIYRSAQTTTQTIYHTGTRRGDTEESVAWPV